MKRVKLKKRGDFRIKSGGLWIFSNEIETSLKDFSPGEVAEIEDDTGSFTGIGYFNSGTLIAGRILSRKKERIDGDFFLRRLKTAWNLRMKFFGGENSFRWIFSEGDFLPGLIIDYYNGIAAAQILTAGMENLIPLIAEIVLTKFPVSGLYLMNDEPFRNYEGLSSYTGYYPESREKPELIEFSENGIKYCFSFSSAQKTGHFFDQRENREMVKGLVKNKRVLDLFSYNGSWSLNALASGAKSATAADSSQTALEQAVKNAEINGFSSRLSVRKLNLIQELPFKKDFYDLVILDPPALIKNRKNIKSGTAAYIKLNRNALKIIPVNGWLISCSCSYHLSQEAFIEVIYKAAQKAQRGIQLVEMRGQAKDHPVLPAMPETRYLKCALLRVID
jgi:23S rRNA (cytosine1962-C5)-methyltransferase